MSYGESFISKVLDTGDVLAFDRYDIDAELLQTEPERKAYEFIATYAEENHGECPDFSTVEAEVEGFSYVPQVGDSFKFLAKEIKEYAGRKAVNDLWNSPEVAELFKGAPSSEFIAHVTGRLEEIAHKTAQGQKVGRNLTKDIDEIKAEYKRRKEGKSFTLYKSKFPSINEKVGGYYTGNTYAWFGRSGRGKSVFVMIEALEAARQGATVLIWSLEMPFYELATRMFAALSAVEGLIEAIDENGRVMDAGFSTRALLTGGLSEDMEALFFEFLTKLNETVAGEIIIRSVDDYEFTKRNTKQLEADIKKLEADIVVIDPIYYLEMEANTSKTAGGDVARTSQRLRHIAGRYSVVLHVITQAEEIKDDVDEEGNRTLVVPKRAEVKKAKQILEDASNLFGIDTCDGRGMIAIGKGRNGGEDLRVEVQYMPEVGIVREIEGATIDGGGSEFLF